MTLVRRSKLYKRPKYYLAINNQTILFGAQSGTKRQLKSSNKGCRTLCLLLDFKTIINMYFAREKGIVIILVVVLEGSVNYKAKIADLMVFYYISIHFLSIHCHFCWFTNSKTILKFIDRLVPTCYSIFSIIKNTLLIFVRWSKKFWRWLCNAMNPMLKWCVYVAQRQRKECVQVRSRGTHSNSSSSNRRRAKARTLYCAWFGMMKGGRLGVWS